MPIGAIQVLGNTMGCGGGQCRPELQKLFKVFSVTSECPIFTKSLMKHPNGLHITCNCTHKKKVGSSLFNVLAKNWLFAESRWRHCLLQLHGIWRQRRGGRQFVLTGDMFAANGIIHITDRLLHVDVSRPHKVSAEHFKSLPVNHQGIS